MFSKKLLSAVLCFTLTLFAGQTAIAYGTEPQYIEADVVFAYDEEMESADHHMYACFPGGDFPVSLEKYLESQMRRVNYRFNKIGVDLTVVGRIEWKSDNGLKTCDEVLTEAMEEIGWNRGMWWNDEWVEMLVAWTDQDTPNDNAAGWADVDEHACLVSYTATWFDDNLLQHELSHLFGTPDHFDSVSCVMGQKVKFYNFLHAEDLRPLYDGGWLPQKNYIWVCGYVPNGMLKDGWCADCIDTIVNNADCPCYADIGYQPSWLGMVATILAAVAVVGAIWVIIDIIRRRKRKAKKA